MHEDRRTRKYDPWYRCHCWKEKKELNFINRKTKAGHPVSPIK
jgi:hypothetical protein